MSGDEDTVAVVTEAGTVTGAHDTTAGAIDQVRADLGCDEGGKVTYSYDPDTASVKAEGEFGGSANITVVPKGNN